MWSGLFLQYPVEDSTVQFDKSKTLPFKLLWLFLPSLDSLKRDAVDLSGHAQISLVSSHVTGHIIPLWLEIERVRNT